MLYLGSDSGKQKLQKLLAENGIVPAFFLQDQVATNATVDLEKLAAKIRLYSINECIIDSTAWPTSTLMKITAELGTQTNIKSLITQGPYIVGSNSSLNQGEAYGLGRFNVANANYRRQKRLLDLVLTFLLFATLPITGALAVLFGRTKGVALWIAKSGKLLTGQATLIGYSTDAAERNQLPKLASPIFDIANGIPKVLNVSQSESALVTNYAKEAELKSDLHQLWQLSKF
jgi:hypothetical protein